jgi:hypothetical protein
MAGEQPRAVDGRDAVPACCSQRWAQPPDQRHTPRSLHQQVPRYQSTIACYLGRSFWRVATSLLCDNESSVCWPPIRDL